MTDIYFAGSIRGGRDDAQLYGELIDELNKYGNVLTEHIGNPNLDHSGEDLSDSRIHERDMEWIKQCDVLVAEVSTPSLGVGYEVGKAVTKNKEVLCLYREGADNQLSGMISGCPDLEVVNYNNPEEVKKDLADLLDH